MKSEQIKEITNKATEQLAAALNAGHSQALTAYSTAIGFFHRAKAFANVLLIASQKTGMLCYIAGFRTWNELGRFVRKGEKGIMILAPIVRRKADKEEEREETSRRVAGFRPAYVFDVSQTDGKELPQIGTVEGDPCQYGVKLRSFASTQGIVIEYSAEIAPARGTSFGGRIALLPNQSAAEEFSTLAHELAHELLHRGDRRATTNKRIRETEAEATAYVVCQAVDRRAQFWRLRFTFSTWNGDSLTFPQMKSRLHIRQRLHARCAQALTGHVGIRQGIKSLRISPIAQNRTHRHGRFPASTVEQRNGYNPVLREARGY